jgi:hypothetical protein
MSSRDHKRRSLAPGAGSDKGWWGEVRGLSKENAEKLKR